MATEKTVKKLKALVTISLSNEVFQPGEEFEASEKDAAPLIAVGAAEEVAAEAATKKK